MIMMPSINILQNTQIETIITINIEKPTKHIVIQANQDYDELIIILKIIRIFLINQTKEHILVMKYIMLKGKARECG